MNNIEKDENQPIVDEFGLPIQKGSLTGEAIPTQEDQQALHNMLEKNKLKIKGKIISDAGAKAGGSTGPKGE